VENFSRVVGVFCPNAFFNNFAFCGFQDTAEAVFSSGTGRSEKQTLMFRKL
jgi:hypothetical protein